MADDLGANGAPNGVADNGEGTRSPTSSRLIIAVSVFFFGIALIIVPSILASLNETLLLGASQFLFWLGFICCALGATAVLTYLIRIEAQGELQIPLISATLPIKVRGSIVVFLLFCGVGAPLAAYTDLDDGASIVSEYHKLTNKLSTMTSTHEQKVSDLSENITNLTEETDMLGSILSSRHLSDMEFFALTVLCDDNDYNQLTKWHTRGRDYTGKLSPTGDYDTRSNPLPVSTQERTYWDSHSNSLSVSVKFRHTGEFVGKIRIINSAALESACDEVVNDSLSSFRGTVETKEGAEDAEGSDIDRAKSKSNL